MNKEEDFWRRVNVKGPNDCWEWTGSVTGSGYGQFWIDSIHTTAHRYAWEISRKTKVPNGQCIRHLCDNRLCCNEAHLICGSYTDNLLDKAARNPSSKLGTPKLYAGEIWLIRKLRIPIGGRMRNQYKFSISQVSKMFKVTPSTIHRIWHSESILCKEGYYT